MKRVLVTGPTGFIGRHSLLSLINKGYEVHAVTLPGSAESISDKLIWHEADLFDRAGIATLMGRLRPTHLLHFAWFVKHGAFWTDPVNRDWIENSMQLVDAFVANGGSRLTVAGSCAEYEWNDPVCSEGATPLRPATVYGECKNSLREQIQAFAGARNISWSWGRIFLLYGPYEPPARLVSSVIRSLLKGEPAKCTHGNQLRDFLYVQDVADAFVALLDSEVTGPLNIASGHSVALKDVVGMIADMMERRDLLQLGALPAGDDPAELSADVRRLREEVGWKPAVSLEEGLRRTIAWWKEIG